MFLRKVSIVPFALAIAVLLASEPARADAVFFPPANCVANDAHHAVVGWDGINQTACTPITYNSADDVITIDRSLSVFLANSGAGQSNYGALAAQVTDGNYRPVIEVYGGVDTNTYPDSVISALRVRDIDGTGRSITTAGSIAAGGGAYFLGNVGIGTATPTELLSIRPSSPAYVMTIRDETGGAGHLFYSSNADGPEYQQYYSGTLKTIFRANGASFINSGNVGIGTAYPAGKLDVQNSSGYAIKVSNSGSDSLALRATASGGGTSYGALAEYTGTDASSWGFYCAGGIGSCGGDHAWTNTSDARLKTAIQDLAPGSGLASILKLRPVRFHWRDVKRNAVDGEQIGFIAQEAEKIYPSIVRTGGPGTVHLAGGEEEKIDDVKTLSYATLAVPLVKAVQELKAENDGYKKALEALRTELKALDTKFEAYKAAHP
ncbi:MAG: tail fiber domain-containing protein [Proteobacteria bacterium]|nr:tail fiber domain-containing protein [Pseudomonadota bacterium]